MSLIKCPECGHEVSTKAPQCPNCGVPIQGNVQRCPVCNGIALMDAEQCPHCGAKFVRARGEEWREESGEWRVVESGESKVVESGEIPADTPPGTGQEGEREEGRVESEGGKGKRGGVPWWVLILGILLVGVGGFFYYEHMQHEATEEKDYERLKNCTELSNYQDFLNRYPDSRHIESVQTRLKELQRIEDEWHTACSAQDSHKLMEFIEKNPTSVHKSMALFKIDSLDWIEADRKGTAAAYSYYIEIHEDGEYVSQAYIERDRASVREARARLDSINAAQDALRDSLAIAQSGVPAAQ